MATFDPLLDTEELHTELLKTIDSKLDVLNLKVEELAASTTARLAHLDSRLEATISCLPNFRHLDEILSQLLKRTAPKSACVFCSIEENVDSHQRQVSAVSRHALTYVPGLKASTMRKVPEAGTPGRLWHNVRLPPPRSQLLVVSIYGQPSSHGQKTQGLRLVTANVSVNAVPLPSTSP
ncbi:hypothetical protein Y032_0043g742 [Ancylostoma ceylanicum]|uniref:Uncharacterized protein n=1 Tax=Ancylostoma ceylanicum TaxID=53326 RepID=A0A016UDU0_9BILA|nr:hypothetical protein Y032_0043g742 [Ancylostoma ceylanicum]